MNDKDTWTGYFTCKRCKTEYFLSEYTTANGHTCRFCKPKRKSKKK